MPADRCDDGAVRAGLVHEGDGGPAEDLVGRPCEPEWLPGGADDVVEAGRTAIDSRQFAPLVWCLSRFGEGMKRNAYGHSEGIAWRAVDAVFCRCVRRYT